MRLSSLIRLGQAATATPATVATHPDRRGETVANVATVTVATASPSAPACVICGNADGASMVVLIGRRGSEPRHLHADCWASWATRFAEAGAAAYAATEIEGVAS